MEFSCGIPSLSRAPGFHGMMFGKHFFRAVVPSQGGDEARKKILMSDSAEIIFMASFSDIFHGYPSELLSDTKKKKTCRN
jgi:hypothetical protein